jgi:hypothetical protein
MDATQPRNRLGQYASKTKVRVDPLRLASRNGKAGQPSLKEALVQLSFESVSAAQVAELLGVFNPRWVSMETYRTMLCHPIVQFGLAIRRSAIVNLQWQVESDDPEIKAFMTKALDRIYRPLAVAASNAIGIGSVVIEKVWQSTPMSVEVEDGDNSREVDYPEAWTLRKVKNIQPETVKYLIEKDEVIGVEQRSDLVGKPVRVGKDRIVHWPYRKEDVYGDPRGFPLLRAAFQPWWHAMTGLLFGNRYFERKGEGIWKARAFPEVQLGDGETLDGFKIMSDAIKGLKAGGVITLPGLMDDTGTNPLFDFELIQSDQRGEMFKAWVEFHELAILRALLIMDKAATGGGGTGSFAQAQVHERTMAGPLETDVREFLDDVLNPQVVDPTGIFNFGEERYRKSNTRVVSGGLSQATLQVFETVLGKVMDAESIEPATGEKMAFRDMIDVKGLAKQLGIPLKSAEELRKLMESQKQAREDMARVFERPGSSDEEEDDEEIDDEAAADSLIKTGAQPSPGAEEDE